MSAKAKVHGSGVPDQGKPCKMAPTRNISRLVEKKGMKMVPIMTIILTTMVFL
jgi:hypothetical protein